MTGKRKHYSAEFKAKVALAALRSELTTAQLATKHRVHQTMISEWKRLAVEGLTSVSSGKTDAKRAFGKVSWRNCMPGSDSCRLNGIFLRKRSDDEHGA